MSTPKLKTSTRAGGAVGLYCPQCDRVLPKSPYWPLSKTKGLHESGSKGHRVKYLHLDTA